MVNDEEGNMRTHTANHTQTPIGSRNRRRVSLLVAVPLLVAVLAACQSDTGLSSEDAAAIRDQIAQVASRLDAVEDRLTDLSQTSSDAPALLISEVRAATNDVGEAKTILADVSNQLEGSAADDTIDDLNETVPNANDSLQDLGNDVNEGINNAGDAINDGMNNAGDAINDGIDNAGDAIDNGLDDTRDALDDARDDTVDPLLDDTAPNAPAPGSDPLPEEQDAAPLGN